jgi:heme-degrading monooxygenase HmoA
MIVRIWTAEAFAAKAGDYRRHFEINVLSHLRRISGFMSASLLRRVEGDRVYFIVMTRWSSMEAIRAFAGAEPERAVVEPEARAALSRFDDTVRHFELAVEEVVP